MIVDIYESKLHSFLFLGIIIVELHLCQQQFRIVVVLYLEISSFWHVSNDFSWIVAGFIGLVDRQGSPIYFYLCFTEMSGVIGHSLRGLPSHSLHMGFLIILDQESICISLAQQVLRLNS